MWFGSTQIFHIICRMQEVININNYKRNIKSSIRNISYEVWRAKVVFTFHSTRTTAPSFEILEKATALRAIPANYCGSQSLKPTLSLTKTVSHVFIPSSKPGVCHPDSSRAADSWFASLCLSRQSRSKRFIYSRGMRLPPLSSFPLSLSPSLPPLSLPFSLSLSLSLSLPWYDFNDERSWWIRSIPVVFSVGGGSRSRRRRINNLCRSTIGRSRRSRHDRSAEIVSADTIASCRGNVKEARRRLGLTQRSFLPSFYEIEGG